MADDDKDYSAASKVIIGKKQRAIDDARDMTEALKKEIHKVHKSMLKDDETRDRVRQEILNGVRGRNAGVDPRIRLNGTEGTRTDFEPDSIVGNERRYWEESEDE